MTGAVVLALHLKRALEVYAAALRRDGRYLPPELVQLRSLLMSVHPLSDRVQDSNSVDAAQVIPLLVETKDAARVLALSEATVRRLVRDGRLAAVYPSGGSLRFRLSDLEEYVMRLGVSQ